MGTMLLPGISSAQSVSALQAEINSLLAEVQQLETQLAATGGSTANWCYSFNTNLSIGMSGSAVTALQTALQKDGESVSVNGSFDDQTAAAVTEFQEKYATQILAPNGLTSGTGYVGVSTRAELNSLFECSATKTPYGGSPNELAYPGLTLNVSSLTDYSNIEGNISYGNDYLGPLAYTTESGTTDSVSYAGTPDFASATGTTVYGGIGIPADNYPGTDFTDGIFGIAVNPSITNSATCAQFSYYTINGPSSPVTQITVNGIVYSEIQLGLGAAAGHTGGYDIVHTYQNNLCYEFALGYEEVNDGSIPYWNDATALNTLLSDITFSSGSSITSTTPNPTSVPTIQTIFPTNASVGAQVTISGTNLGGTNTVLFNGLVAASNILRSGTTGCGGDCSSFVSHDVLTFTVPNSLGPSCQPGEACPDFMELLKSGNYSVSISNANGTSNALSLVVTSSVTPISTSTAASN